MDASPEMVLKHEFPNGIALVDIRATRLRFAKTAARKGCVEINAEVRLKDESTDFINALADMEGVESAVLVSYNGDYMG